MMYLTLKRLKEIITNLKVGETFQNTKTKIVFESISKKEEKNYIKIIQLQHGSSHIQQKISILSWRHVGPLHRTLSQIIDSIG